MRILATVLCVLLLASCASNKYVPNDKVPKAKGAHKEYHVTRMNP